MPPNKGMKLTNLSEAPRRAFRRFAAVRTGSQLIPGVRQTRGGVAGLKAGGRMRILGRVVAILVAAGALEAASPGTIQVHASGKLRGAFEPRGEPYETDGPSVSVYLEKHDVKTADGQALTGLEFIGWQEGQGVRVQVFLLLPAKGAANTYLPEGKPERLARRYFSSVLLAQGDEVALTKMRELGLEPMKLRLR